MSVEPQLEPIAVSIAEAARLTGLSRSTVYAALANGRLRALRMAGRTLVPVASIHEFLNSLPAYQSGAQRAASPTET